MYTPTNKGIFVGRQDECRIFEQMLDNTSDGSHWVMQIYGEGGIGKTQLLRRLVHITESHCSNGRNILFADSIDFDYTANRQELGILKYIADQINPKGFLDFYAVLNEYQQLFTQDEFVHPIQIHSQTIRAREKFLDDYQNIDAERIILFFDTAEKSGETVSYFWQNTLQRLKEVNSKTIAVITGRSPLKELPESISYLAQLNNFTLEELNLYFSYFGIVLTLEEQNKLLYLCKGRPLLVALALDWYVNNSTPFDLSSISVEDYEATLTKSVVNLQHPLDYIILTMSHLHRRFDGEILSIVHNIPLEQANEIIHGINTFSFVKSRPSEGCSLHDEMRELVNRYVWSSIDPSNDYRRELTQRALNYYDKKIEEIQTDLLDRQALVLEKMDYWLTLEVEPAFDYARGLLEKSVEMHNAEFLEAINRTLLEYTSKFSPEMLIEFKYYQSMTSYLLEDYHSAVQQLEALVMDASCSVSQQLLIKISLIELYTVTGNLKLAIDSGLEIERSVDVLRNVPVENSRLEVIKHKLGFLYNNLAVALRTQNKLALALDYHFKALACLSTWDNSEAQIALFKNELGLTYRLLGRYEEALNECELSLRTRLKLNNLYGLGNTYHVLGMIYADQQLQNEALKYYEAAIQAFSDVGSERGQALVYTSYGRLLRHKGLEKEKWNQDFQLKY